MWPSSSRARRGRSCAAAGASPFKRRPSRAHQSSHRHRPVVRAPDHQGLAQVFRHAAVLAEEGTALDASASERRIIDPLDGTVNCLRRLPVAAGVHSAREQRGVGAGRRLQPHHGRAVRRRKARGATLNGAQLHKLRARRIEEAVPAGGFPATPGKQKKTIRKPSGFWSKGR